MIECLQCKIREARVNSNYCQQCWDQDIEAIALERRKAQVPWYDFTVNPFNFFLGASFSFMAGLLLATCLTM